MSTGTTINLGDLNSSYSIEMGLDCGYSLSIGYSDYSVGESLYFSTTDLSIGLEYSFSAEGDQSTNTSYVRIEMPIETIILALAIVIAPGVGVGGLAPTFA